MNRICNATAFPVLLACVFLAGCRQSATIQGAQSANAPHSPATNEHSAAANAASENEDSTETRRRNAQLAAATDAALKFLLSKQSDDGGFKSETYGSLRNGACTTSLVLYAASHLPAETTQPHHAALLKACRFLHPGIQKKGTVAAPDGTLDYPTYSAAMLLLADERLKLELTTQQRKSLLGWLLKTQLTEAMNVPPDSMHYGGWDIEAEQGGDGSNLDGSNISITSFALEALSSAMEADADAAAAVRRAVGYVRGCQNADGGFVFHRWRPHPGNKAGWKDKEHEQANSYGSPTCDGLRSLHYCGLRADDQGVAAAVKWLEDHPEVKLVPGFPEKIKPIGWHEGLRFYYYLTQAKALPLLPAAEAARRAQELRDVLVELQRPDGGYKNEQPRMFEDDELFATSLALVALAEVKRFLPKVE